MPRPIRLLLGLAPLLLAPLAFAQNNLGELLDRGAERVSAEAFRQDVVQRVLVGSTPSGTRLELMYATSGVIQGRGVTNNNILAPVNGVWNIDDSGRICTSLSVQGVILPFRCQYWFKYKDEYFAADSDSDRGAKVLRRVVQQ